MSFSIPATLQTLNLWHEIYDKGLHIHTGLYITNIVSFEFSRHKLHLDRIENMSNIRIAVSLSDSHTCKKIKLFLSRKMRLFEKFSYTVHTN